MANILVTGGQGFIGVNLCKSLADDGHNVWCLDNMLCPSPIKIRDYKRINFIQTSVEHLTPENFWNRIKQDMKLDEIYHLASIASPVWYKRYPMQTIVTNVMGTDHMCKLALHYGAKLLLSSSSEVYGQATICPQEESYYGNVNILGPRSSYDESKRCAETIVYEYMKMGLRATIVRIHNCFGPGLRLEDGRFIVEFIKQSINNDPLTIFNNGEQTRSLTYIDDMINGLIAAMESPYFGPINLGSTDEYTVNQIADLILYITGSQSSKLYIEGDIDDPLKRLPSIDKAKKILNWKPKVKFRDGLIKTIKYVVETLTNNMATIIQVGKKDPRISIIDQCNFSILNKYNWQIQKGRAQTYYAITKHEGRTLRMHRMIMEITNPNIFIDHVNHNGLDNRTNNLRICTINENNRNKQKCKKICSSVYKGVYRISGNFPWIAQASLHNKRKYLSHYATEKRAALAYDDYQKENYGEFINPNFPNITSEERDEILKEEHIAATMCRQSQQSHYIGVRKRRNKWESLCRHNNKRVFLGSFTNEIDAAKAYDEYVIRHKLKRKLNFEN
jgi:nucleoside-diphosphate-sugar epimerase